MEPIKHFLIPILCGKFVLCYSSRCILVSTELPGISGSDCFMHSLCLVLLHHCMNAANTNEQTRNHSAPFSHSGIVRI